MVDTEIDYGSKVKSEVSILDVLGVDPCRDAILDHVHIKDIVCSERVCRRWQQAVLDYLLYCRNLTLAVSQYNRPRLYKHSHRTVTINDDGTFRERNVYQKLGPCIKSLLTNQSGEKFYEHITSFCPRLRQIELKYLSLKDANISEEKLGRAFQNIELEKIKFVRCDDLSGKCLQLMNLKRLKSLSLVWCLGFRSCHLESNASSLGNVRTLEIISIYYFRDMLTLIDNMPKLENLIYRGSFETGQLVEYCSRLDHLKSIHLMEHCDYNVYNDYEVDDEFLEGLARGCKKLEYLNIPGSLAALFVRPSPGTSICFARVRSGDEDEQALLEFLRPLNNELKGFGCKRITQKMLNKAFELKEPDDLLELRLVHPAPRNTKSYPELKIVINVFLDRILDSPYTEDSPYNVDDQNDVDYPDDVDVTL